MFAQLFKKPLSLTIAGRILEFDSKSDFEFALGSRTEVPAARVSDLVRSDTKQLVDEANGVRHVERHLVEILSRSIQEPASISYLLREMDMKMFSQDHDWRTIMQELSSQDRHLDDYKQLALVKYMQYLASRQDVLKGIYTHKVAGGMAPGLEAEHIQDPQFRQTMMFDISGSAALPVPSDESVVPSRLIRLPRGESITLHTDKMGVIELVLSRHAFTLRAGLEPRLVDDAEAEYALHQGRNVLGRHPDSDVMVDAAYRDVSRTHAIVEMRDDGMVCITDLSSHGTFVDANCVDA